MNATGTPPRTEMALSENEQVHTKPARDRGSMREWLSLILVIGGLFFFVRWFLFEPFRIPSESMLPTLEVGDMVVVSKFSYGYGDFSLDFDLPFMPDNRLLGGSPKHGEIAVFRHPRSKRNLIKRIIGLPGDTVQMINGQLFLNGEPMPQKLVGAASNTSLSNKPAQLIDEQLIDRQGEVTAAYQILNFADTVFDNTPRLTIPADTYFFMGDNRDNSGDSRSNRDLGLVHKRFLIGKAEIVLFSLNIQAHPEDLYFWAYWNPFRWGRFVKIL
ncbi:MAG: signal peptidase I [Geminicoccus sp.]|nr:signal peptidase I [Geminicoccus sp.]